MQPGDFRIFKNVSLNDSATSGSTSSVGEPAVLNNGKNIFYTGNWYASRSSNNASSWNYVSPYSKLPSAAGGFCCDQLCLYEPSRNISVWLLQYSKGSNGENIFRIAINNDDSLNSWYWWDFSPSGVDSAWAGLWFDYPDMSVSNNYLWITFNVFDSSDRWQRSVVFKMPLDPIANRQTLGYRHWSTTNHGSLRLTQGADDAMYFGSHNSTSQLRVFRWPENTNSVGSWNINVSSWSGGSYSAPGPDGNDWLGRTDPRITGAWSTCNHIGFMWTANRQGNRPFPHARVVKINRQNMSVISQPDIWSNNAAYAYPAVCPNARGHLGVSVFYGGGSRHPSHLVGISDDYNNSGWSTMFTRVGTNGPSRNAWGDYLTVKPHSPDNNSWIASGYTLSGGTARTDILPRYVHFGRRRDQRGATRWS